MGYTKLFNSILASTIWRADDKTRIVWITLLAMADRFGMVEGSIPGIADFARVSLPDCEHALAELQAPDEYSRSKECDGRRIQSVEGGWRIINHGKYRAKMGADERREYLKLKQREYRRREHKSTNVNKVSDTDTVLTHTEAEAKADTEAREREKSVSLSPPAVVEEEPKKAVKVDPFLDPGITARAGRFVERYAELYPKYRKGARYAIKPVRDYASAVSLCQTWPDDRLEKLAVIFLTCENKFAEEGSRTVTQFLALASWADGLLSAHEQETRA